MGASAYEFEWDPTKEKANFNKHGVHFEQAAQVFRDPLALTIRDEEHSESDTHWITLGTDASGRYVLVVHTFVQVNEELRRIRLISARRPTRAEIHSYEEEP
jgi:uncharacterized protein